MVNSITTTTPPILAPVQPSFAPAFFQNYAPETAECERGVTDAAKEREPRISYTADRYKSHNEFCASADFRRYRKEMRGNLDGLTNFCRRHGMKDAEVIADNFERFFRHRFKEAYFDTHAHLVDGPGKLSLDHFCEMVDDERFSLDARKAAVRDLSQGVGACASGAVSNLIDADRQLSLSTGGIRATIWTVKEDITRSVLQAAVAEKYGHIPEFAVNEIHIVNAAWNYIASAVGLREVPDLMAPRGVDADFLESCRKDVLSALAPDRIASIIAEQCLGAFGSQVAARRTPAAGRWTSAVTTQFEAIAAKISADIGIPEKPLRLHGFLQSDDDAASYTVRSDASLIAWDLLKVMDAERLLETPPASMGDWVDEAGYRSFLYTCGAELAWCVQHTGDGSVEPSWDADPNLPTLTDLVAWSQAQAQSGRSDVPPAAAVARAIAESSWTDLARVPASWVGNTDAMLTLLDKLNDEQMQRYLEDNLPYFRNEFPEQYRGALVDRVMGRADIATTLVRDWYSDPWALIGGHDGKNPWPMLHEGQTYESRLHRWVMQDNAAAIDAMGHIVRELLPDEHELTKQVYVRLALRGRGRLPILGAAMAEGKEAGIDAWHRLLASAVSLYGMGTSLKDLLNAVNEQPFPPLNLAMHAEGPEGVKAFHRLLVDPAILPHIEKHLPKICLGQSPLGAALYRGMAYGSATAVNAYAELLTDPAIFSHIKPGLPELIRAAHGKSTGLLKALQDGHADIIHAYRAILTNPAITPEIVGALSELVATETDDGVPGLLLAMQGGHADAVRAYHALLTDPVILPHIVGKLRDLIAAKTRKGTPALAMAMQMGRAAAIKAYHALLTDPAILPHVHDALPELLLAKRSSGDPALWLAAHEGHAPAIEAFHALLADPLILPRISVKLPELLATKGQSGSTALAIAMEKQHAGAVSAFYAILADPKIAMHLHGKMADLMRPASTSQVTSASGSTTSGHPSRLDQLVNPVPGDGRARNEPARVFDLVGPGGIIRPLVPQEHVPPAPPARAPRNRLGRLMRIFR